MGDVIWRHLGFGGGVRGDAPRCGHHCTADSAGAAEPGETVGKFKGVPARLWAWANVGKGLVGADQGDEKLAMVRRSSLCLLYLL